LRSTQNRNRRPHFPSGRFVVSGLIFLISVLSGHVALTQQPDLSVPEEILKEMETVKVMYTDTSWFSFRVVPPKKSSGEYDRVALCFSGGDQSEAVVNYCYAAWFRSPMLDTYWKILPVSIGGQNLRDLDSAAFCAMTRSIVGQFNCLESGWLALGTSNGGIAAFKCLAAEPQRFEGLITVPGSLSKEIAPDKNWSHLKILLAVGQEDQEVWHSAADKTIEKTESHVRAVQKMILKKTGHVLPIGYKVDRIYKVWFNLE